MLLNDSLMKIRQIESLNSEKPICNQYFYTLCRHADLLRPRYLSNCGTEKLISPRSEA